MSTAPVLEHVTTEPDPVPGVPLADAIEAIPDMTRYQPMTARELEHLLGPVACTGLVECLMAGTIRGVGDRYQGCEPPPEGERLRGMLRGIREVTAAAHAATAAREAEKAARRKAKAAA